MESSSAKRKADDGQDNEPRKSSKRKKWQTPKKGSSDQSDKLSSDHQILPGDSGIWATCELHREAKCVGELRDLLQQYASKADQEDEDDKSSPASQAGEDIENELRKDVAAIKAGKDTEFKNVKIDVPCLLFMKTPKHIDPVGLAHEICKDSMDNPGRQKGRWIKRLIPITLIGKATENGLIETAKQVLAPHFHVEDGQSKKFAIRPSIRAHSVLKKDWVIQTVAGLVGSAHSVDLKNYDSLILVEIYKNVCGLGVVGSDYEALKRYNLSEIYHPTSKE